MFKTAVNLYKMLLLAALVLLLIFLPTIAGLYADIAWYQSLGFSSVFYIPFATKVITGAATFLLVTGALLLNFQIFNKLNRGRLYITPDREGRIIQQPKEVGGTVKKIFVAVSVFIGILSGIAMSKNWATILKFLHQKPFNASDPVFGHDISYYVFTLPFIQSVAGLIFFLLVVSIIFTGALYAWHILFHHYEQKVKYFRFLSLPFIPQAAKKHLSVLVTIWFLLTAFYLYAISLPGLVLKKHELLSGANYTDLHAHLPVTYILIGIAVLGVLTGIYTLIKGSYGMWAAVIILYLGISIAGGSLYPALLQSLVVEPNELSKEYVNLERHISSTRKAWDIDKIKTEQLAGAQDLAWEDIEDNKETIENIRLWDRSPLLDTYKQIQEIRTYYKFNFVDNARYHLNGEYRQLALAVREIDYNKLPARNFINERLTYTHGMGVAVSPLSQATEEGLPKLYVKDLPPVSEKEKLQVEQPAIYYGESQNDHVITNTESKEFHYPRQDENIYKNYAGQGGVALDSYLSRSLMAINFGSYKIFLNTDITPESRLLYHRNIRERVEKALPFLSFDSDPYLIIANGRLKWIQDAYTETDRYPYSASMEGVNYMRNSVKVVVDAYEGDINAYIMEEEPLIRVYASIFPKIFKSAQEMPAEIKEHIRYPEDLFSRQTVLYGNYHMEDPQNFYNKEDLWNFPRLMGTTRGAELGPVMRRLIMKLPHEDKEEFIFMLPYTPQGRQNLISWMAARSDGENYGELINYRFPKDSLAYGPQQIVSRINQKPEISQQISLWDQRGSEVIQGNLYVIPVKQSILYVRPLYLRARDSQLPELKRVIAAHGESIAMEPTLEEALKAIFGEKNGFSPAEKEEGVLKIPGKIKELTEEADELYDQAVEAQKQGKWGEYGNILEELKEKLKQLQTSADQ